MLVGSNFQILGQHIAREAILQVFLKSFVAVVDLAGCKLGHDSVAVEVVSCDHEREDWLTYLTKHVLVGPLEAKESLSYFYEEESLRIGRLLFFV